MAVTPRQQFERSAIGTSTPGLPDFPKLPDCLKKHLTAGEKEDVDKWEAEVREYFKKQATRGL